MFKKLTGMVLIGIALEIIWIAACSLGPLRDRTRPFLILMILAFTLCVLAYFRFYIQTRKAILLILGFALIFRLTVLFSPPHQSEDVYRYLWDARISSMGINPYTYPPDAPELEKIRDDFVYPMINSKPYITAYPPLSQVLFRFSYELFGANVVAMKSVFSLLEFLAVLSVHATRNVIFARSV